MTVEIALRWAGPRARSLGRSTSPLRPGPPAVGKKKAGEEIWILASTTNTAMDLIYMPLRTCTISVRLSCIMSGECWCDHVMRTYKLPACIYLLLRNRWQLWPSLEAGAEIVTVRGWWDFTTSPENPGPAPRTTTCHQAAVWVISASVTLNQTVCHNLQWHPHIRERVKQNNFF